MDVKTKSAAILSVLVIVGASFGGIALTRTEEEPDGIAPLIVLGVIAAFGGGFATGWFANDYFGSDDVDTQSYLRLSAANSVTDITSVATAFTTNANANYAQLWSMTKEHWIRQAELEAYAKWGASRTYDANSVLEGARLFENNAVMTANAVAQFNSFMNELSQKVDHWNGTDTYKDKMSVGFVLDNTQIFTRSGINADLVSVAKGTGKIYIDNVSDGYIMTASTDEGSSGYTPGYVYNFGTATTIVSDNGNSLTLSPGKNMLPDGFRSGVYTVTNAVLGGDSFSAVVGSDISLKAGLAMNIGSETVLAYLENGKVLCGNGSYGSVSFRVVPDGIPSGEAGPEAVELTSVLKAYQTLLDKLYWTTVTANNSSEAVWNVYDRANAKDHNVTTLMASNVYETTVLSASMNEILTLSAMQQLASYYDVNGEDLKDLRIGLYATGMDAPFVRGTIYDEFGNAVYKDVIFTPFFQSESVTLEMGIDHEVKQNCLVAIWHSGQELNSWYGEGMDAEDYETVCIGEGYTLKMTQLAICNSDGMNNQAKLDLQVSKVNYLQPEKIDLTDDPDAKVSGGNILRLICVVAGSILAVLGIVRRNPVPVFVGLGVIVFGVFFADSLWERIGKFLK